MPAPTLTFNSAVLTPVLAELIYGSQVTERYRYELLDNSNSSKGFLNCVLEGGQIESNYLADIKRRCSFTIAEIGNFDLINFYSDRVKIYYEIYNYFDNTWMSFPLGVYGVSSGDRVANKKVVTRAVDGFDLTLVLKRKKHTDRLVVPAGTNPVEFVRELLNDSNLPHAIEDLDDPVGDVLPAERSYDTGSEYIATINDLLSMVNYKSLYFDNNGIAVSGPYVPATERTPDLDYLTDNKSIVSEGAGLNMSIFDVPNKVIVVVSQPDRPAIVGSAINENPESPTSTVSVGEERVYVSSDNEDVTTLDQANAKAYRLLSELSQVYETITFNSATVPLHGENTILNITHNDLGVSAVYSETEWRISLKAGEPMTHSARRLVQL